MMPELHLLHDAPSSGFLLLMGHHTVLLAEWQGGAVPLPDEDTLEELHIFDMEKEYRAVWSEARGRYLEAIITDETFPSQCAEEEPMYLDARFGKRDAYLAVRSYYDIDEDEVVYLSGYRMLRVGGIL